mmetsp:Transcript_20894/g.18523  ORF Transcript_20894/g.18523 Transcript_20894/m.18523 type:complete len:157 (+) Transcript_20894:582-1052(+)
MYAAEINSPFNSYLFGYAFSPIISALGIFLGNTILRSSQNLTYNQNLNPIEDIPIGESIANLGEQIKTHHVSYNEKFGTLVYYSGVILLVMTRLFNFTNIESPSTYLYGDIIAFCSAFFGIVFQFMFIQYSMRSIYRIIEFLLLAFFFASCFSTTV